MRTKKIVADTMPLALKMVRQQLGENAIIVNTKSIKTGGIFGIFGKQKFEVTAYAIDKEKPSPQSTKAAVKKELKETVPQNHTNIVIKPEGDEDGSSVLFKKPHTLYQHYSQNNKELENHVPGISEIKENDKPLTESKTIENDKQLLDELQQMRKMMMNFMMGEKQGVVMPEGLTKWINRLKKQGVNEEIIEYIVNEIMKRYNSLSDVSEEIILKEVREIIEDIINTRIPLTNKVDEGTRMINVIGPTGVGKTTSIAKLATEQVLRQKRRVAMITTDVYRIGAVEQLKTYAGILNVPFEVVRSANELEKALTNLEHYDLIYMDTTGRNYKELQYRHSIDEYLKKPFKSDHYLVLSLTTKYEDMQVLLDGFLDSPIKKLIMTKFDETTSYGSILNIAYSYPYKLAYITTGQSVPEDINETDAKLLASYLLGEGKENGSSSKSS